MGYGHSQAVTVFAAIKWSSVPVKPLCFSYGQFKMDFIGDKGD